MESKRKRVERLKSLAIVALTISAVLLSVRTQISGDVMNSLQSGWFGRVLTYLSLGDETDGTTVAGSTTGVEGLHPVRVMIKNEQGRYGQQYSTVMVNNAFERLGTVLGTALNRGQTPQTISEARWYAVLDEATFSVYFDFLGRMPLSILAQWLGGETETLALTAQCRELVLAGEPDGTVTIYYSDADNGGYYAAETTLNLTGSLDEALEQFVPNGATFAFQHEAWEGLAPSVIVADDTPRPVVFEASNPITNLDEDAFDELLRSLSFPPKTSSVYPSADGQQVVQDGDSTLRIAANGVVTYRETEFSGRYPVTAWQENPSLVEKIESARQLVIASVGAYCGEGGLYLADVVSVSDQRVELYFNYVLEGAQVKLAHQDYAASIVIEGNYITEYTFYFRNYQPTEEYQVVLPLEQAVAAMDVLDVAGQELVLCYQDWNTGSVVAGWAVQS